MSERQIERESENEKYSQTNIQYVPLLYSMHLFHHYFVMVDHPLIKNVDLDVICSLNRHSWWLGWLY